MRVEASHWIYIAIMRTVHITQRRKESSLFCPDWITMKPASCSTSKQVRAVNIRDVKQLEQE